MAAVMQGLSQLPPSEAAVTLAWLVAAGIDTAVDDAPRHWLTSPPPVTPIAPARPSDAAPRPHFRAPVAATEVAPVTASTFAELDAAVAAFAHPLRRPELAPVLVSGNTASGVVIICEQPEAENSPAATLRTRMLAAIGLDGGNAALLHRLPWPTTGARSPRPDELTAFAPFVDRALELARPRLLLALGQTAAALAGEDMAVSSARGRWAKVTIADAEVPLLATLQPRVLLTHPLRKREAWTDLQTFAARMTSNP